MIMMELKKGDDNAYRKVTTCRARRKYISRQMPRRFLPFAAALRNVARPLGGKILEERD